LNFYTKNKIFELISTKEITFLKDLDRRISINKTGKFYYKSNKYTVELDTSIVRNFLHSLDTDSIYTLILILSANNTSDQPYIVLSKQILITKYSNTLIIHNYIENKINDAIVLYNIDEIENFNIVFKYKKVDIQFNQFNTFNNTFK
jgi:predicted transcriptional regulator